MTASSMAVDYTRLLREFCRFAGYDQDNLTVQQSEDWTDVLKTTINQVFHPPLIPTLGTQVHQWSWARPVWTLETAADQDAYPLPIDFERFIDSLCFDTQSAYRPIPQCSVGKMHVLQSITTTTGVPMVYALEPLPCEGTREQTWQVLLYPTPGEDYQLIGQYQMGARMLSEENPYPPGGPVHGELWVASLLAAAEARIDNDTQGAMMAAFMQRLMSDVSVDMQKQTINLGYAGDGARGIFRSRSQARRDYWLHGLTTGYTTYQGSIR